VLAWWRRLRAERQQKNRYGAADRGIMVFEHTSEVIRTETMLKGRDLPVRVMGPPPEIQTGCDLVIEFPLIEELTIRQALNQAGIAPLKIVPVTAPLLTPVDLFTVTDFGDWLMVRAANMKMTVAKDSLRIVNISGGGCPDVPYLANEMVGKTLAESPRPRDIGKTLCGYALELAHQELCRRCLR
jgi:hypothetical protein